ncbi:hypothetical protein LRR18_15755 [Mangrovimonas sp. AS39]|uniref:hypothetical protein n=1 Tax=Mangrovimonas TaxID=1211036 RepID=UPI0006B4F799|nr:MULTISPECIES: hypothetical protein [Mangrovimonas]MCF1193049.1 hypothetical protein [Mangrovimonas futianensis]MCF1196740.1 hypothetical protein [Mangrovimonas futianensis]MCF1423080.1 hypothetical protein [Mangrovimonas futianensis]NIK92620.1 hypothetical protein [Mangrovimonas sp. CR14]
MISHFTEQPIYQKALEIFVLSRSISSYLNHDLSEIYTDGKENRHIYFSGDIVQQSISLAPEIAKAEQEICSEKKYKHIASVRRLTNRLYHSCRRLENCNSNGRDYVWLLRRELHKFRKLERAWSLTL